MLGLGKIVEISYTSPCFDILLVGSLNLRLIPFQAVWKSEMGLNIKVAKQDSQVFEQRLGLFNFGEFLTTGHGGFQFPFGSYFFTRTRKGDTEVIAY
jgi:hypothetical protein